MAQSQIQVPKVFITYQNSCLFVPYQLKRPILQSLSRAESRLHMLTVTDSGPTQIEISLFSGFRASWTKAFVTAAVYLAHNIGLLAEFCQKEDYTHRNEAENCFEPRLDIVNEDRSYFFSALYICLAGYWESLLQERLAKATDQLAELNWVDGQIAKANLDLRALKIGPLQHCHLERPAWRELVEQNEALLEELTNLRTSWEDAADSIRDLKREIESIIDNFSTQMDKVEEINWWVYSTWNSADAEVGRRLERITELSTCFDHIAVERLVSEIEKNTPVY